MVTKPPPLPRPSGTPVRQPRAPALRWPVPPGCCGEDAGVSHGGRCSSVVQVLSKQQALGTAGTAQPYDGTVQGQGRRRLPELAPAKDRKQVAWSWGPKCPRKGRTVSSRREGATGGAGGGGRGWPGQHWDMDLGAGLAGGPHRCRAGSWNRSRQNWTKALRSVLLMPPTGLMSALEQSYLVR